MPYCIIPGRPGSARLPFSETRWWWTGRPGGTEPTRAGRWLCWSARVLRHDRGEVVGLLGDAAARAVGPVVRDARVAGPVAVERPVREPPDVIGPRVGQQCREVRLGE